MGPSQALSRGYRWAHKPGLVARTHRYRVQTARVRYRGLTYTNSEDCCKIWTVGAPARYRSIAKSIDGPIIGAFPWLSAGPSQALFRGCRWAHIHGLPVHTRRSASSKRCAHSGFGNNATGVPSLRFIYRNGRKSGRMAITPHKAPTMGLPAFSCNGRRLGPYDTSGNAARNGPPRVTVSPGLLYQWGHRSSRIFLCHALGTMTHMTRWSFGNEPSSRESCTDRSNIAPKSALDRNFHKT